MKKKWPVKINTPENQELAFNYALKYLSYRSRSTKEVFDYLLKKNFQEETANVALKKLVDMKFLNDDDFARRFTEQRQTYKGKSKLIIKSELKQKGVNDTIISEVLADAEDDLESAKIAYRKKARILSGLPKEEFNKKMMGFLARRGFSWEIIKKVINEA